MDEPSEFTVREIVGLLPGGWTLAEPADPGGWQGQSWCIRLVDGADVPHEARVDAKEIERHGRLEALRQELDRLYRGVAPRGLLG